MPFQKGNTLSKKRKRASGGRPSKTRQEITKEATEIAKAYIGNHLDEILGSYRKLIKGRIVKHFDKVTGALICEEEVIDSAAVRHAVDTIVPKRAPEDNKGNAVPPAYYIHPPLESEND